MSGIGALIIGDEIILGRRQDKHFARIVDILAARGLKLDWALYAGDDRGRLVETLRRTLASGDIVFSCGGIGNTPDDHTRQAAAAALGLPLELHADAEREIRARYAETGREVTPYALDMGRFPAGSRIIPNPVNRIAGFSHGDHHFVPGFPQMAWPMIEWVLDTQYADRFNHRLSRCRPPSVRRCALSAGRRRPARSGLPCRRCRRPGRAPCRCRSSRRDSWLPGRCRSASRP
jgi:molybdopterin-biosynthesis enzyme MoeA-like protein